MAENLGIPVCHKLRFWAVPLPIKAHFDSENPLATDYRLARDSGTRAHVQLESKTVISLIIAIAILDRKVLRQQF